jgi:hypothetical protein
MHNSEYSVVSLFLFIYWTGLEPSPLLLRLFIGLLYQPWMIDDGGGGGDGDGGGDGGGGAIDGMNGWQGKPTYSEKLVPGASFSNTNPT